MISIKQLANCIGVSGNIRIVRDFFGYAFFGHGPASLSEQARLLQGKHVHVNLIRVGIENFTDAHERELDRAVQRMRAIYAVSAVRLGIGRVRRYYITEAQAQTMNNFLSELLDDNAKEITDKYTVFNDAIDVFFVLKWGDEFDVLGRSDTNGSCDKTYDLFYMTGCVVSIETSPARTARTLAHEVGHYLGLGHESLPYNLMTQGGTVKEYGIQPEDAVQLNSVQGSTMRSHCFVKGSC